MTILVLKLVSGCSPERSGGSLTRFTFYLSAVPELAPSGAAGFPSEFWFAFVSAINVKIIKARSRCHVPPAQVVARHRPGQRATARPWRPQEVQADLDAPLAAGPKVILKGSLKSGPSRRRTRSSAQYRPACCLDSSANTPFILTNRLYSIPIDPVAQRRSNYGLIQEKPTLLRYFRMCLRSRQSRLLCHIFFCIMLWIFVYL